jgi:L-aspartate oxidase
VYRFTTNPNVATGDGVAMAYRAGARVEGLEFYQFHPTLLYHPTINNFLMSEALRGEEAYLRLPETGERFMQRYAPSTMELTTRDIVARAIFCEIEHSNYDYVHLDIRHKDKDFLQQRFPSIYRTLLEGGLDLSRDLIPVVPAAHYMGGGILTDVHGKTDLKRLFAIGETAFTGFHGANRLASNSLLEGIVMGRNLAHASLSTLNSSLNLYHSISDWDSRSVIDLRRASQINVHWRGLRGEMSSYAGIIRTEAGLRDQLKLVLARRDMIEEYYWKYSITRDLIELRNIILIAELIVRAALNRRESCGGHYREDREEKASV